MSAMFRSLALASSLILGLAFGASAQVVVNGGTATTYPVGVPAPLANTVTQNGIPSVPAINTPTAHVGPTAEQAPAEGQANAGSPGVPMVSTGQAEAQATAAQSTTTVPQSNVVSLGVATYSVNPFIAGSAQNNNVPLGTLAREYKQKDQNANARVYTNADIDKLQGNTYGGAAANANARNDNWPANNGVITQPAVAAPAQNQSTTGIAPNGSFSPVPQNGETPTPQPQSLNQKPSADRPVEMAQNNPANAGIPQNSESNTNADAQPTNTQGALPKTATRLPLLAVLGFFSVTVGMFVRHQRSKTAR
jgi:hypothetical protein